MRIDNNKNQPSREIRSGKASDRQEQAGTGRRIDKERVKWGGERCEGRSKIRKDEGGRLAR